MKILKLEAGNVSSPAHQRFNFLGALPLLLVLKYTNTHTECIPTK